MKKKGAGKKPGDTRSTATTAATPPTAADGSTLPTIASAPGDSSTATSPAPTASPSTSTTTPTVETDAATKSDAADVTKPTAMPKATMAACPDDHLLSTSQRTKRDEMVASFLDADPSNGVDVCFSFDTTGSMYCYLEEVRAQVEETCKQLFKLIPKIRISIITHGDFCDDAEAINILDFTERVDQVCRFVKNAPCTCGGDAPENYEYVLHKAYELSWIPNHAKALVMIGDCEPHPPSYTDRGFYWRDAVDRLFRNLGVKVYSCHCSPHQMVTPFYVEISRRSGGVYFTLNDFHLVTYMFKAVCYREYSIEQVRRYASEVSSSAKMRESLRHMFSAMSSDLQFQQAPRTLTEPWWDIKQDHGSKPQFYSSNNDKNWKRTPPSKPAKKVSYNLVDDAMAKAVRAARCRVTEADCHGANTRTGTRILETAEPVETLVQRKAAERAAALEMGDTEELPTTVELFLRDGWIVRNGELIHMSPDEYAKYMKEHSAALKITASSAPAKLDQSHPPKIKSSALDAAHKLTPDESKAFAEKRLMRDIKELERTVIYNVSAVPLSSDIFVWHCNMGGPPKTPYADVVFHLVIKFSIKYPRKPPVVNICTKLYHPNVFGCWVCLDMLENGGWDALMGDATFTGWSSGYSLTTILIQLQAFLFAGIETEPRIVEATRKLATNYKCIACGHEGHPGKIFPPFKYTTLPHHAETTSKSTPLASASVVPPKAPSSAVPPATASPTSTKTTKSKKPKASIATPPASSLPTTKATKSAKSKAPATTAPVSSTALLTQPLVPSAVPLPQTVRLEDLKPGMKLNGRVVNIRPDMGVFVDIGTERDGLIPSRLLSPQDWERFMTAHGSIVVYVDSVNLASRRLYLTTSVDPFQEIFMSQHTRHIKEIEPGMELIGYIKKVTEFGATLDIKVVGDIPIAWGPSEPAPQASKLPQGTPPAASRGLQQHLIKPKAALDTSPVVDLVGEFPSLGKAKRKPGNQPSQPTPAKIEPPKAPTIIPTASLVPTPLSTVIPTAAFPSLIQAPAPGKIVVTKTSLGPVTAQLKCGQIRGMVVIDGRDFFKPGMLLPVQVLSVDPADCKIDLMCKPKNAATVRVATKKTTLNEDLMSSLEGNPMSLLSVDSIYKIFNYLSPIDITRLGLTCKFFHKLAADGVSYVWERNELVCFHSKRSFMDDTLGVGLNLENKLNGKLAYITTTFDLLSYEAFMLEKVRMAAYREPFTHWLPLYINKKHAIQAIPLAKEAMGKICAECYGSFEPWMVCEVIPKIMNSLVVQVMTGKLHASIMAIEGYCAFHHLFLMFLDIFPELRAKVDSIIATFINDEKTRNKREVPALGEWLPLLTVTETYSWKDVAVPYLHEMFDRNVLWTLKKFPQFVYPTNLADAAARKERLDKVFEATTVSNHLAMFHVYFLKHIGRPDGVSLTQVRQLLDIRYGRPTYGMKDQLQKAIKAIRQVKDWETWFQRIHVPYPGEFTLCKWLNKALENSNRRHYHREDQFIEQAEAAGFYSPFLSPEEVAAAKAAAAKPPPTTPTKKPAAKKPKAHTIGKGTAGAARHLAADEDDGRG